VIWLVKPGRKKMSYRVSYDVSVTTALEDERETAAVVAEEFSTEHEAFKRAREILEDSDHGAVSVRDSSGNVLCGVLLQLKLGFFGE
jgi:hypothetical protein